MRINNSGDNNAHLEITNSELESLIKVLRYVFNELEFEYSTRTGFSEDETQQMIKHLLNALGNMENVIYLPISHQAIFIIRQNLVEVLFGIDIKDFEAVFGSSKEILENIFK